MDLTRCRELQDSVISAFGNDSLNWKITGFVTPGSALSHAEFLISRDRLGFAALIRDLVLPQSPPVPDAGRNSFLHNVAHTGQDGPAADMRADHGALFAAVRWTNIFDPSHRILAGYIVSGPLTRTRTAKPPSSARGRISRR